MKPMRKRKRLRVRNDNEKWIPIERFDRGNLRPCPFNANARAALALANPFWR
jgi:hypothetical protein